MNTEQALQLVASVGEEDLFEHGKLFSQMDPEPICWRVLEAVDTDEGRRVTFHLYWRDVFLKAVVALMLPDNTIEWRST